MNSVNRKFILQKLYLTMVKLEWDQRGKKTDKNAFIILEMLKMKSMSKFNETKTFNLHCRIFFWEKKTVSIKKEKMLYNLTWFSFCFRFIDDLLIKNHKNSLDEISPIFDSKNKVSSGNSWTLSSIQCYGNFFLMMKIYCNIFCFDFKLRTIFFPPKNAFLCQLIYAKSYLCPHRSFISNYSAKLLLVKIIT